MIEKIEQLLQEVDHLQASNTEELEALRIKYLSKKGAINALMADFRHVPADQKKAVGMRLNELKDKAQEKIAALKEQFEAQDTGLDDIDLTRTAYPVGLGTRHPGLPCRRRRQKQRLACRWLFLPLKSRTKAEASLLRLQSCPL